MSNYAGSNELKDSESWRRTNHNSSANFEGPAVQADALRCHGAR